MKSLIVVLLAFVSCTLAVVVNGQTEKDPCDLRCHERKEYKPICGFNGKSYQRFANSCYLSIANCKNPNTYTVVSLQLCDKTTVAPAQAPTRLPVIIRPTTSLPSTTTPSPTPKPSPRPTSIPIPKPTPTPLPTSTTAKTSTVQKS